MKLECKDAGWASKLKKLRLEFSPKFLQVKTEQRKPAEKNAQIKCDVYIVFLKTPVDQLVQCAVDMLSHGIRHSHF